MGRTSFLLEAINPVFYKPSTDKLGWVPGWLNELGSMQVQTNRLILGLSLQAASLALYYAFDELLYSGAWLAILVIAIPLFVVSVIVLMNSGGKRVFRILLSFWPLTIPLIFAAYGAAASAFYHSR